MQIGVAAAMSNNAPDELQEAEDRIMALEGRLKMEISRTAKLEVLLNGRDDFLVRMGLWMTFVEQLPK